MINIAKARPSYPREAIERIKTLVSPPSKVLDLGAGTGIMTKLLVTEGYQVTAVDPVSAMRKKLSEALPSVPCLEGTSWSIPVETNSQDAVMLAQCFHWFDDEQSLTEIHRVLKPGGVLLLIWNMESQERSEWVARIRELYQAYDSAAPQYRKNRWQNVFKLSSIHDLFQLPLQHQQFIFDTTDTKRNDIWTRVKSKSYIAVLDEQEQQKLFEKIDAVLEDPKYNLPKKDDNVNTFTFCHDTDLFWCYKKE